MSVEGGRLKVEGAGFRFQASGVRGEGWGFVAYG